MERKIIITGTHLTPAQELIGQLKEDKTTNWQIVYIGRLSPSIESKIIPELNIKFYGINCGKFDRKFIDKTILGLPNIFKGIFQAHKIIKIEKPDIIVSFGGYVSVPVVVAGKLSSIPSITHEQTFTQSLATKINSFFVNKVALSFPIDNIKKSVLTGNLLRRELFVQTTPISSKPIIFITAGNQGSVIINSNIKKILPSLKKFFVIHQTGNIDYKKYKILETKYNNYKTYDYIPASNIGPIFTQAEIIISRAGANTTQEIIALNKKSILIPLPFSQQNEQLLNAQYVQKILPKRTIIIPQIELNHHYLLQSIKKLSLLPKIPFKNLKPNLKLLNLIHEII